MERILVYLVIGILCLLFGFKELVAPIFLPSLPTNEILSILLALFLGQLISIEINNHLFRRKTLADKDAAITDLREERDYWRNRAEANIDSSVKYFPPSTHSFNEPFYDFFCEKLANAKNSIYVVGMGFTDSEYNSPAGQSVIRNYNESIKLALRNGVSVFRIQSRTNISIEWAKTLKELLDEFPTKFNLYYFPVSDIDIVIFSVIDPDISIGCAVEILISSNHLWVGTERPASSDFTAMFIMDNVKLAESFQKQAIEMMNPKRSTHINNSSMVDEVLVSSRSESVVTTQAGTILRHWRGLRYRSRSRSN